MQQILLMLHVFIAIALIALVLIQHGKGADMGAAFGSGSSNTMFGSQGATPTLVKLTAVIAFIFFVTSLSLGYLASSKNKADLAVSDLPATTQSNIPDSTSLPAS